MQYSLIVTSCIALVLLIVPIAPVAAQSSSVGAWAWLNPWPIGPIHMQMLPTEKVLFWGGQEQSGNETYLWDPANDTVTGAARPGYDTFCSGHSFLSDGRLLVTGGQWLNLGFGLDDVSIYNPFTGAWTRTDWMWAPRWYPTNTTLPNGDVLVTSGIMDPDTFNALPQVWQSATGTWKDLTDAILAVDMYPWMHVMPDGAIFMAGPAPDTFKLYVNSQYPRGQWFYVNSYTGGVYRDYGSSVLYDTGKILIMGGGQDPPTNTAEVIDMNQPSPAWRTVAPMAHARRQINATLLPDGKVLVTGGTNGPGFNETSTPVYPAELWDPATETWTTMASQQGGRFYHSMAALLPDGRVLSAGGNFNFLSEIYSPPYLFNGPRPTITSAPASVAYGQTFFVGTSNTISKVTWIRLPSVTHAFDQDQRINRLGFSQTTGGLNVTAPSNSNLAPPGYYMLFILNGNGVPSVAKIIKISASGGTEPLAAPTNLTATAVSRTRINLAWTDNASNETGYKVERATDGIAFTQIAVAPQNATSYANTGLTRNTTYHYRVRATNGQGDSAYSNTAQARTQP